MKLEDARNLQDYNSWATQRTLGSVAALTPEQFTRDLGSSFKSVRDTLVHVMSAEWVWLERLHGKIPTGFVPATEFPTLASVADRWKDVEHRWHEYVATLSPADLDTVLQYKNMRGIESASAIWQILQHVANHSTYHRGQITTMLRQLGANAVSTDLIAFYRERAAR
jgi:uncharacterized damage-inducible protein DinB